MKEKIKINIEYVDINLLKPAEYNPRKHNKVDADKLKKSIQQFGAIDPLIVNCAPARENVLIGGHFRLEILKELGYKEAPIVYVNIPDIEKEKEISLRLNRNTGSWNFDLLKEFDMDLLLESGFDNNDLSDIWDSNMETENDGFSEEEEIKKIDNIYVNNGDLFQLGNHRLICGDSANQETVKKILDGEKTSFIYCDPNYNISLNYNSGIGGKATYGGKTNDHKPDAEYKEFLKKTIANALSAGSSDLHIFYYCDQKYIGLVQSIYEELGISNQRVCLWIKNGFNVTPQVAFSKCYEPCIYGIKGKPFLSNIHNLSEIMNKEVGTGNRTIDDILDIIDIWLAKRLPGQEYEHPTQKPTTLHEKALRRCTKINDIVLDLFGGSGSTLIACEQLKRKAYLVEIEPIFVQLIINRYEKLTGKKAKKLN